MANVGVRSPYFFYQSAGPSPSVGSVKLEIYIDTGTGQVLRYTLLKDVGPTNIAAFEIAELIRDYIEITYAGSLLSANSLSVDVELYYTTYTGLGGTGTAVGPTLDTSFRAFEGYAFYTDDDATFFYPSTDPLLSNYVIWAPLNTTGYLYYTSSGTALRYDYASGFEGTFSLAAETIEVRRFPCSKYTPIQVVFLNRYGVIQQLWFFSKIVENVSVTRETYKSSKIGVDGTFTAERHQIKTFNANGKQRYTLNTGHISEDYNESMKELLLSEQVWAHIDGLVLSVNVVSSDVTYKTSLNNKLVDYSIEIEQANDLISTMR
jgi:hypothetical protein